MVKKSVFQRKLDEILENFEKNLSKNGKKPSLLLHACCAPCSSYVLEYLAKYFEITILYYNPNIYPEEEYRRRLGELEDFLPRFAPALEGKVKLVKDTYEPSDFYAAIGTDREPELAKEPEKGERCRRCYQLRLRRAYDYASAHKFDYFCTTLSISPFGHVILAVIFHLQGVTAGIYFHRPVQRLKALCDFFCLFSVCKIVNSLRSIHSQDDAHVNFAGEVV